MLVAYETATQALLQSPSSPIPLIPTATLDVYINQARLQVAAEGACIRNYCNLILAPTTILYLFSSISGLPNNVSGIYHIRQLWYQIPQTPGQVWIPPRPFEWMSLYGLNNSVPTNGPPKMWSQYGQGTTGSIFVNPPPDLPYACFVDTLCVPLTLITDSTAEAIPPLWQLAVPFYAAWLGFMSAQRQADADMMLKRYQEQMALARNAANPDLIPESWSQSPDPMMANRLNAQPARAG